MRQTAEVGGHIFVCKKFGNKKRVTYLHPSKNLFIYEYAIFAKYALFTLIFTFFTFYFSLFMHFNDALFISKIFAKKKYVHRLSQFI